MGVSFLIKKILQEVGINPDRFGLQWASAAEAPRFVRLITDFTAKARELGPIGKGEGFDQEELQKRLQQATRMAEDRKLRMAMGTATKTVRKDGIFTQEHIDEVFAGKLEKPIKTALGG